MYNWEFICLDRLVWPEIGPKKGKKSSGFHRIEKSDVDVVFLRHFWYFDLKCEPRASHVQKQTDFAKLNGGAINKKFEDYYC